MEGLVPPLLSLSLKSKVTREGRREESKRKEGRKERRKEGREGGIKGNRTCHPTPPPPQPPHPQRPVVKSLCSQCGCVFTHTVTLGGTAVHVSFAFCCSLRHPCSACHLFRVCLLTLTGCSSAVVFTVCILGDHLGLPNIYKRKIINKYF